MGTTLPLFRMMKWLPPALLAVGACKLAWSADAAPMVPDTSNWACKFCAFDYGWKGYLDAGIIGVNNSDYWFGRYNGLYRSGVHPLFDGELRYRDEGGRYLDVVADRLGLMSRSLSVEAGRQGRVEFKGSFQGIPDYRYRDAYTPFLGSGSSHLTLPENWVPGDTPAQMSNLDDSLRRVGVRQKREVYGLGLRLFAPNTRWTFDVNYRHDRQTGNQITGANFLTTSSLLLSSIDYDTDQVDAGAQYVGNKWHVRFGYYGSFFHDADNALTWSNPFNPFAAGADVGRMSTAPDNSFHQLSVSGAWQLSPVTRLMASAAVGEALQDDNFIPYTINPDISTPALPRNSLDGRIDTGNYVIRLTTTPVDKLSLVAEVTEDRRDNKTSSDSYRQVVSDLYVGETLINLPYSFDRTRARVIVNIPVSRLAKLEFGGEGERYDRSNQIVGRTETVTGWGELRSTISDKFGFSFKYDSSHRSVDDIRDLSDVYVVENPLLMRFDMAERDRDHLMATVSYTPLQTVSFGLSAEHSEDDYDHSSVGLTQARNTNISLTGNWTPTKDTSLYVYLTRQLISAKQAGSQTVSLPDWFARTSDRVSSVGIGSQWKNVVPQLDLGANAYYSYTTEGINIDNGSSGVAQFPRNTFRSLGLRFFAKYQISPKSSLRFDVWHENYSTRDWALDGVGVDTIPTVLSLGIDSPDYRINEVVLSYRYTF